MLPLLVECVLVTMGSLDSPEAVDRLWEILDPRRQGYVDYNGLKKGLKRMDHREEQLILSVDFPPRAACPDQSQSPQKCRFDAPESVPGS